MQITTFFDFCGSFPTTSDFEKKLIHDFFREISQNPFHGPA